MEINFSAFEIYFRAFEIYFKATEITFLRAATGLSPFAKEFVSVPQRNCSLRFNCLCVYDNVVGGDVFHEAVGAGGIVDVAAIVLQAVANYEPLHAEA